MEGLGWLLVLGAAVLLGEHPAWPSSGGGWMPCPHHGLMPSCPLAWALQWSWAAVGVLAPGGGCSVPVPMPGAVQEQGARSACGIRGCIRFSLTPWGVCGGF